MGTSIAPHVAGWAKRGGRFGWTPPFPTVAAPAPIDGGTGDVIGLTVELYLNSMWVDVSQWAQYRDGATKIPIGRGRGDETSQTPPQTATVVFNNRDGRFSMRNPTGPYYGQLTRNTPMRVSRLNNGVRRYRIHTEVPAWPMSSDISGADIIVTVPAAGLLRRLSQGNKALRSPMVRSYLSSYSLPDFGIYATPVPVAYWPCEDGTASTQIASAVSGGTPMIVSGSPSYAQDNSFPGSSSLPKLSSSSWTGAISSSATTVNMLRFLLSVPSTGATNSAVVARMITAGTVSRLDVVYTTAASGTLTMNGYGPLGATLFTTSTITGVNAQPGIVAMELSPDPTPGSVDYTLTFIGLTGASSVQSVGGVLAGSLGVATQVVINPGKNITDTALGHVAYQTSLSAFPNSDAPVGAVTAWNGESPVIRFLRLCGEQGVPAYAQFVNSTATNPGDETAMGYQTTDTFATLLQQIADTAFLPVYESRDQLALTMRSKGTMYNQAPKLTLDMSLHQLSTPLVPVDDDALIRNDVTVSRNGGSSYEAVLTSGPMSTQPPPAGVGVYDTEYPISLASDSLLADQAGWRLLFGTVNEPRYPQVSLNLRHPTFTSSIDMMNAALTLDIGDRIVIKNAPVPQYPSDDISLIVQGYSEVLGTFEHDMVINCTPESPWRVGLLDDAVLGHLDTDGSTLAADYPLGTETSLSIATTGAATGSPLWTTSAGDFPFDVNIGGERVTVTNITGAASPQTFTATRSVNGIIKAQTHNTDVRLWQPLILSV